MKIAIFGMLGLAIVSAILGIVFVFTSGSGLQLSMFPDIYYAMVNKIDATSIILFVGSSLISIVLIVTLVLVIVKRKPVFIVGFVMTIIGLILFESGSFAFYYASDVTISENLLLVLGAYLGYVVTGALVLLGNIFMIICLAKVKKLVVEKKEPTVSEKPIVEEPVEQPVVEETVEQPLAETVKEEPVIIETAKKEMSQTKKPVSKKVASTPKTANGGAITYHISQRKELNKWQVKRNQSEKAVKLFDTQKAAIDYAKDLAKNQNASIRIHSKAGKIRKE